MTSLPGSEVPQRRRVLAVGLDGASFELLQPWIQSGDMPNLAALVNRGVSGGLESVIPPLTPPAWTTAVTGVNPGKHGVFNFLKPKFGRAVTEFFGTADWKTPALWDYLGARNLSSVVLHLPATYPPRPIEGVLVAGLPLTNVDANSTWPPELKNDLQREIPGYRLFPDTMLLRTDRDAYFRNAVETLRAQTDEALYLMEREPWSLMFTLWHMGDSLKHYFWEDMTGASGNEARRFYIRDYYREVDRALGRVVERAGTETHLVVLSDHGHQGVWRAIFLNGWLAQNGLLKVRVPVSMISSKVVRKIRRVLKRRFRLPVRQAGDNDQGFAAAARALESMGRLIVWDSTKAHAEPPGFVWINVRGRDAAGVVEPGEQYETVCREIVDGLLALRDPQTNLPVVDRVVRRDEAFAGGAIDDAPDLVVLPREGYITEYGMQAGRAVGPARQVGFNGYHVMRGMVAFAGPDIRAGETIEDAQIADIAPTVMYLLGLPHQPVMDGHVLTAAIRPDVLAKRPVRIEAIQVERPIVSDRGGEQDAIEQSLRDLGYM